MKFVVLAALAAAAFAWIMTHAPRCDTHSVKGPRIAGAILIAGCP